MRMSQQGSRWCVVVADDHGPEWGLSVGSAGSSLPIQYCCLGKSGTLLQRALRRASRVAPESQILVTLNEGYRELWEPPLWWVRPSNRYIGDCRAASLLTTTAALLSIASESPSHIVTILPARCYAAQEWVLSEALDQALSLLPQIAEGALTLGMVDLDDGIDEDYLIASRASRTPGLVVQGMARRPVWWIAKHLRRQGAMIASGIQIGYAGAFAAHIVRYWPKLAAAVTEFIATAGESGIERNIPAALYEGVPSSVLRALRWHPPLFPQRAICVFRSGWSGLRSARASARISAFAMSTNDYQSAYLSHASRLDEEPLDLPVATS